MKQIKCCFKIKRFMEIWLRGLKHPIANWINTVISWVQIPLSTLRKQKGLAQARPFFMRLAKQAKLD